MYALMRSNAQIPLYSSGSVQVQRHETPDTELQQVPVLCRAVHRGG